MIKPIARRSSHRLALAAACLLGLLVPGGAARGQNDLGATTTPTLRAEVTVSSDLVRIGDIVDNAGDAAQIAIYRAPDLGTTGSLPVSDVLSRLGSHHIFAVDTAGLKEISVTRAARVFATGDLEQLVARVLERKSGLGVAADIAVSFDRDPPALRIDPARAADVRAILSRYDARTGRFDITFDLPSASAAQGQGRLRLTGVANETAEVAVVTRQVERGDILRKDDVTTERRPKAEIGQDGARESVALGMQTKKPMRAGQVIHTTDIGKPDLVQRDQAVTIIYRTEGLQLTMRAKALESGGLGDTISVINPQSKRTLQGIVSAAGQITITPAAPITTASIPVAPLAQKAR